MKKQLDIGYHDPLILPLRLDFKKYIVLLVGIAATALFLSSAQYLMLIWSVGVTVYIVYDMWRIRKVTRALAENEAAISQYCNNKTFTYSSNDTKVNFMLSDKRVKVLCSSDSLSPHDELIRTVILCISDLNDFIRIRMILRDKVYVQVRIIPKDVAVDLWASSEEKRAKDLGKPSPFRDEDDSE